MQKAPAERGRQGPASSARQRSRPLHAGLPEGLENKNPSQLVTLLAMEMWKAQVCGVAVLNDCGFEVSCGCKPAERSTACFAPAVPALTAPESLSTNELQKQARGRSSADNKACAGLSAAAGISCWVSSRRVWARSRCGVPEAELSAPIYSAGSWAPCPRCHQPTVPLLLLLLALLTSCPSSSFLLSSLVVARARSLQLWGGWGVRCRKTSEIFLAFENWGRNWVRGKGTAFPTASC